MLLASLIPRRTGVLARKSALASIIGASSGTVVPLARWSGAQAQIQASRWLQKSSSSSTSVATPTPQKSVFTPEQLEAARLARLAGLGPFVSRLPEKWRPYAELMRLEKPAGTYLLLLPSLWGITMASYAIHAPLTTFVYAVTLFSVGALIMRGAGCTINDLLDRDMDSKVLRSVERPIASGRISVNQAIVFLAAQLSLGLAVLLSLPFECFYLGALSLPFISTYPLFKRFTYYPQVMISICFSWGCMLGFPAVGAPVIWLVAGPLFLSNFLWSMIYDTIYAHQDKEFDKDAGVKSTALRWQDKTRPIINKLWIAQCASLAAAGVMNSMGPGFFTVGSYAMYRLRTKMQNTSLDKPESCWNFFTDNIKTGAFVWLGILIDYGLQLLGLL